MNLTTLARTSSPGSAKTQFTEQFQQSLSSGLRRKFSVEELFGRIWEETLDAVPLKEDEERQIYSELLEWARHLRK